MQEIFILETCIEKLSKINETIQSLEVEEQVNIMHRELASIKDKYRELESKIGRPSLDISSYDVAQLQVAGFTQQEIAFILETGKTSIYKKAVKKDSLNDKKENNKNKLKINLEIEFEDKLFQKKDVSLYIFDENNMQEKQDGTTKQNIVLFRQIHMLIRKTLSKKNTIKVKVKSKIVDFSEFEEYAVEKLDLDYKLTVRSTNITVEKAQDELEDGNK